MTEPRRKPGRTRLDPSRPPLTNTERSRRWRERHRRPPTLKPPKPDPFPGVKTFAELVAGLEQRARFDPEALIG